MLAACVRLRLLDALAAGPRGAADLAPGLGLTAEAAERLLRAAAALRLVEGRGGGRFGLGPLGAAVLGNPGVAAMVEHHAMLYADLADPVALLRARGGGRLAAYWAYAEADRPAALEPERVRAYTALMAASQPLVAQAVLDAWPIHRHRRLLDVGGGDGSFLAAAAARAPGLALALLDLPPVVALARERLTAAGLVARVAVHAGDFRRDPLPEGADLVTLVRVLHDHDDAVVAGLLGAVRRMLPPDGVLLVAEPMAGTRGAEAAGDAYFGFYLMAMGRGRPRTAGQLAVMLRAAGFGRVRETATAVPLLARVLVARR